jgi:hypothetical protein
MKHLFRNKLILAFFLSMAAIGCSSASVTGNNSNSNAAAALPTPTPSADQGVAAAGAAQKSPDALVAELYKQHDAKKSPFFQSKDRAPVDKYFSKSLADMIWKDATRKNQNEVGVLDGDPLYNAQDTEIKNFKVGAADIKGDKAAVAVTFDNFGTKQNLKFSLIQEKGAWKISDIDYGEAGTLASWFKEDTSANNTSPGGEFEGKYQIGDTTCTVKPVKMAFEVRWVKGKGAEMYFSESDAVTFATEAENGKTANSFVFDDEHYNTGTFHRSDGKDFSIKRVK